MKVGDLVRIGYAEDDRPSQPELAGILRRKGIGPNNNYGLIWRSLLKDKGVGDEDEFDFIVLLDNDMRLACYGTELTLINTS